MRRDTALSLVRTDAPAGHRVPHVGILVPWANQVVEAELPRLCGDAVVFHYARLVPRGRRTRLDDEFLGDLCAAVPDALDQLVQLPLDGVLLACTSAGFSTSAQVTTAFDALVAVLRRLSARQVVLATPYPQELTEREMAAFVDRGILVLGSAALGRDDDLYDVTADEIRCLIHNMPTDVLAAADVLVLSCTAWPTLCLLAELEAELSIPVVSSNLAMAIQASRLIPDRLACR